MSQLNKKINYSDGKQNYELFKWYTPLHIEYLRWRSSVAKGSSLEEDLLDFEPENGNDEFTDKSGSERNSGVLINSDQSTVKIVDSDGRNTDRSPGNCSTTTEYIGHRREMLPVPQIDAADGRQHEYFPYAYSTSASTRTVLDSSSDDSSSDSDTHDNSIETESDLCQSDFSNDEQGSDYDLSQEEEDKLLGNSDEESSPTFSPIISGTVDVCTIGNSRITLPKFITGNIPKVRSNVSKGKCGSNDLKRTTPLACQTVKQKKRKKWDLYFKPTISHAHVFLQDIGFISNDTDCDSVSTNRTPTLPKLFVICNDSDKIVCEKRSHEFTRESAKSGDGDFKLPLPPPKRPPTRPKRTVCNSNESFKNLQIHVDNVPAGIRRRSLSGSSNSTMSYTGRLWPIKTIRFQ
ncbi:hypothetical protein NQ318_013938 [Aromia moschata]|uniref:Uncharacterized protein n=1 Tax=Aromia moschata TaxID=1265417 RepID=A0AAV8Z8X7_9CUCU|nr:hypothetical protein NQ318_013938 [Aromia moschata]